MINFLSVIMPTYNCGEYIHFAVDSILKQSFKEFEFIIVDDGSTDNTEEVVNSFKDIRIKYIKRDHKGFVDATNYGISIASSKWIARMDADDIAMPLRLEKQINFLNSNPRANFVSCWYALFNTKKILLIGRNPIHHQEIVKQLSLHSVICHSGVVFNVEVFTAAGCYVPDTLDDYDLWLRIMNHTNFYNYPEVLMLIRERSDSLSRSSYKRTSYLMKQSQDKYYDLAKYFMINNETEKNIILGWRKWFYGDKSLSRKVWSKIGLFKLPLRIIIAYLISFLPEYIFIYFKKKNMRLRLKYIFNENYKLKKELRNILIKYI